MKRVHHAVEKWREEIAGGADEKDARQECIHAGKDLCGRRAELVDLSHSTENHCRIQKGVNPLFVVDPVVTAHSDRQRHDDSNAHESALPEDSPREFSCR